MTVYLSPGYHQDIARIQHLSGSSNATSQQGKKFCLSHNCSGTEIIDPSGLLFRLKQNLVHNLTLSTRKGKGKMNFSASYQISMRQIKSQEQRPTVKTQKKKRKCES